MTPWVFPDNTVFCNFAAVHRLELLRTTLAGRGRWTGAVADEASRSMRHLPDLAFVVNGDWMGEPIVIDEEADSYEVERIRRSVFGGNDQKPAQHLGEAQSCYLIERMPEWKGSWWISDDRDAVEYGRKRGLTTLQTGQLLALAVVNGDLTCGDMTTLRAEMTAAGRHVASRFPVAHLYP